MMIHDPSPPAELDIPGMIAMLKEQGYRVSKPRAKAADEALTGCVHCGSPVTHRTSLLGGKTKKLRTPVGLCTDCYRFGPRMHSIPIRPVDPVRAARLLRVWRRAHHRYARRYAAMGGSGYMVSSAERLAGRILFAMGKLEMTRDYVPESKIPGTRRMD